MFDYVVLQHQLSIRVVAPGRVSVAWKIRFGPPPRHFNYPDISRICEFRSHTFRSGQSGRRHRVRWFVGGDAAYQRQPPMPCPCGANCERPTTGG